MIVQNAKVVPDRCLSTTESFKIVSLWTKKEIAILDLEKNKTPIYHRYNSEQ